MKDISKLNPDELIFKPFSGKDFFRISISDTAYEELYAHAEEDNKIEICGVLIGDVYKDEIGPYIEVTNIIKGEHAQSKEGQVMFTYDTWAYINEIKESKYKKSKIIGWYHSHPGYGIFLSQQDIFIHENFFNQIWQVAFVVDPKSNEDGFFVWSNDKPTKVLNYSITGHSSINFGRFKKAILTENNDQKNTKKLKETTESTGYEKLNLLNYVVLFVVISILLFSIYTNYNNKITYQQEIFNLQQQIKNMSETNNQIFQKLIHDQFQKYQLLIKNEIDSMEITKKYNYDINFLPIYLNDIKDIKQIYKQIDLLKKNENNNFEIFITADNNLIIRGYVYFEKDRNLIVKKINNIKIIEKVDIEGFTVKNSYTVRSADSLKTIAKYIYGDEKFISKIYKLNSDKIKNKDSLTPGIELKLPE